MLIRRACWLLLLFAFVPLAGAQLVSIASDSVRLDRALTRHSQQLGVVAAYSLTSSINIGQSQKRRLLELDGRYARTLLADEDFALNWVAEVTPLALLHEPTEYYKSKPTSRVGATTYGAGIAPLGLQLDFGNRARWVPFIEAQGGMLYFLRQEPVPGSSQFNFTFNFGAGLEYRLSARRALSAAYRYHHFSNNETAAANPGVDNQQFTMGYLWRWK